MFQAESGAVLARFQELCWIYGILPIRAEALFIKGKKSWPIRGKI
jgi:hypothetical protein